MLIEELTLRNFRNLRDQTLTFPERLTFIVGKNGQGKTNLLEAIHLLAASKPLRNSKPSELMRWGISPHEGITEVEGRIRTDLGTKKIRYRVENGRRSMLLNDKRVQKASQFFGQFRSIDFTPEDLFICQGSPAVRRQFLDRILALYQPAFVDSAQEYDRALKSRNAILREGTGASHAALRPWAQVLAEHGVVLAHARAELVRSLSKLFTEDYRRLSDGTKSLEQARIIYESELLRKGSSDQILSADEVLQQINQREALDIRRGKTTFGVHTDDLGITLSIGDDEKAARGVASQGQARSIVLSLKLSALEVVREKTGELPVLLLDDVESELDAGRRAALKNLIADYAGQVFVTNTEIDEQFIADTVSYSVLRADAGRISRERP